MEEKKKRQPTYYTWQVWLAVILTMIWAIFMHIMLRKDIKLEGFDKGYKQGQIDALNGIQNWDKIVKKDTIYIKIR